MSNVDETKVNTAIRQCLERCYGSSDALSRVASFIADLQAAGGWNRDEIRALEMAVHKVLQGIVVSPLDPGEATRVPADDGGEPDGS